MGGDFQETTIDFSAMTGIKENDSIMLQVGDQILDLIAPMDLDVVTWLAWIKDNYNSNLGSITNIGIENSEMKFTGKKAGVFDVELDLGESSE